MGRSYNKVGRRNDSKKSSKRKLPYHKPVGRPRSRWVDMVQRDALQLLGIRGWRRSEQRRMEASYEGGQGPEGAVVPWMDGWGGVYCTSPQQ